MTHQIKLPAVLLLALFLFGCGQSGPLYVTGNPSTIQPAADSPNSEDEEQKDADETDSQ